MNRKVLLHIGVLVVTMTASVETSACFLPPDAYMDFTGQGDYYYNYYMYALRVDNPQHENCLLMEASSWDYGPLRSFDPDGDGGWLADWQCGIQTWTWGLYSYETGSPISGYQYTENTSPEPPGDGWLDGEHTFHITSPGQYWLMLKVVDTDWYEGGPGNLDDYRFYRLGVFDLGILGSSYVQLNNDDDNVSGIADCADAEAPLAGENDLMPVCLWFAPVDFPGEVELKVPDGDAGCIRVWENSDKTGLILPRSGVPDYEKWKIQWGVPAEPKTVYVEARGKPGNSEQKTWLVWNYVINGDEYVSNGTESIRPVVLEVDIDIAGVKDDDYYWPGITEETTPGAFIPLGDVVKIERLKVLPENESVVPVNMLYPVILSAPAGSSKIRVWADQQKTVPVTLPAVYFSRASVPNELWVEGYEVSDSLRDITLRWWWNGFVDEIKLTVYAVDNVQWETYPDDVYVPGGDHGENIGLDTCPKLDFCHFFGWMTDRTNNDALDGLLPTLLLRTVITSERSPLCFLCHRQQKTFS